MELRSSAIMRRVRLDLDAELDLTDIQQTLKFALQRIRHRYGITMAANVLQAVHAIQSGVHIKNIPYFDNFQRKALLLAGELHGDTTPISVIGSDMHHMREDLVPEEYVTASKQLPVIAPAYASMDEALVGQAFKHCIWHVTPTKHLVDMYRTTRAAARIVVDLTAEPDMIPVTSGEIVDLSNDDN